MFVSRSEVSLRVSIQREAASAGRRRCPRSLAGSGSDAGFGADEAVALPGPQDWPGNTGSQRVRAPPMARGTTCAVRCGARRRAPLPAPVARGHLPRGGLSSTCTSFSASAKVPGETSGPTGARCRTRAALRAAACPRVCSALRHADAAAISAREARFRNCLRDFDMHHIVAVLRLKGISNPRHPSVTTDGEPGTISDPIAVQSSRR